MINKTDLQGRIVFAGVGNVLKGDDGFGSVLAQRIDGRVSFRVFDASIAPENYLGAIVKEKPDTIVFADTADFEGRPGEIRFMPADDFEDASFFLTHNTSLKMLFQFIEFEGSSARVFLLGCQPGSLALGDSLSVEVAKTVRDLTEWFCCHFPARGAVTDK